MSGKVTIPADQLAKRMTDYASIKDFNALTGGDLQKFGEGFRKLREETQDNWTANVFIDPEMEAFLWIITRDDESRNQVYASVDDMRAAMARDLRRLSLSETAFGEMAEQAVGPAPTNDAEISQLERRLAELKQPAGA